MHPRRSKLLNVRAARRWVVLVLWGLLAGCATGSAGPSFGGVPVRSRLLLASGEGQMMGGQSAPPSVQGYNVPGRNPTSQAPWEFFLGNAAHRLIAYMYKVNHPERIAYFNSKTLFDIIANNGIGDSSRLLPHERNLRPDITDVSALSLFEIKPWGERGLQEGLQEAQTYLSALNRAVDAGGEFTAGTDFQGQMLIRFAQGQYIWRLEWQTFKPGVVQYRWTRSQQRFESAAEASDADQWVSLTVEEMRLYGGWVGQAVEGMVTRREQLASFSGAIGFAIDIIGEGTKAILTGAIFGRMNSTPGAQQPPSQGGGRVIPFPARPSVPAPEPRLPAAVGM